MEQVQRKATFGISTTKIPCMEFPRAKCMWYVSVILTSSQGIERVGLVL